MAPDLEQARLDRQIITIDVDDKDKDKDDNRIVAALALRSFHLPGYSAFEDWWQYTVNHHPVWGICCHHRLHPLPFKMRLLYFLGSVMFGLAVTNCMWLALILTEQVDQNQVVFTIRYRNDDEPDFYNNNNSTQVEDDKNYGLLFQDNGEMIITHGMILLWTVGGGLHALFDQTIWFFTTCPCCLPGQALECCLFARPCSRSVAVVVVIMATAVATLAVLLRASLEVDEQQQSEQSTPLLQDSYSHNRRQLDTVFDEISAYDFLVTYGMELALSYLIYYPLVGTLFFSGILGCYRIPVLGGRPYEMRQLERRIQRQQSRSLRHSR